MNRTKRERRHWNRKTHTGYVRSKRVSRRALMRLQARLADATRQAALVGQGLADLPKVTTI
jgi:hypothetical protein